MGYEVKNYNTPPVMEYWPDYDPMGDEPIPDGAVEAENRLRFDLSSPEDLEEEIERINGLDDRKFRLKDEYLRDCCTAILKEVK